MSSPLYHHVVDDVEDDDDDAERTAETHYGNKHVIEQASSLSKQVSPSSTDSSSLVLLSTHGSESYSSSQGNRRQWAVALFSVSTILLFADQNLMSPNLSQIAHDFGFDEEQRDKKLGGEIALAFFVLGAPASFVVGCLGDSYNRTKLFAWTVGIGEGACIATYFARTYPQLYVCRAITGFSIGGALPLIYSVLGDLFAAEHRHGSSALIGIGTGVGIALGQGISGFLGPTFGWRLPFLVVGIPSLLCAAVVFLTVRDPERGAMEQAVQDHQRQLSEHLSSIEMTPLGRENAASRGESDEIFEQEGSFDIRVHFATFWSLLSTPTVILSLLQGAPGCLPWGVVNTYLNDFLSENRGMTVEFATFTVLIFGLGNFFGMVLGGAGGSFLYRIDKRFPALLAGSMAILGCFPFWIMLNQINNSTSFPTIATVSILAGIASGATGPIVKATLQNVTLPQARGQAFALFNTFDDFGRGLGPVFVAMLITNMGGRTPAFNVAVLGWMFCGVFNLAMFLSVNHDEGNVQATIAARLTNRQAEAQNGGYDSYGILVAATDNDTPFSERAIDFK